MDGFVVVGLVNILTDYLLTTMSQLMERDWAFVEIVAYQVCFENNKPIFALVVLLFTCRLYKH